MSPNREAVIHLATVLRMAAVSAIHIRLQTAKRSFTLQLRALLDSRAFGTLVSKPRSGHSPCNKYSGGWVLSLTNPVSKPRSGHSPCNACQEAGLEISPEFVSKPRSGHSPCNRPNRPRGCSNFLMSPNREAVIHLATRDPVGVSRGGVMVSPNREAVIHLATTSDVLSVLVW